MNDFELIYLYQTYQDEDAFNFMHQKYHKFIWKIIHTLYVDKIEFDDLYQESMLTLLKAMTTFQERFNKSFTRYFELILRRHLYYSVNKMPKYVLSEEKFFESIIDETPMLIEESDITFHLKDEQNIYTWYFLEGRKVKEITILGTYSTKQVYNLIYRVKDKLRYMVKKSNHS